MNDEIRYGVIGSGLMGQEHLRNLLPLPGTKITALADPYSRSLREGRNLVSYPVETFSSHQELLAAGICDAVVVASPNHTHNEIAHDVIDAGLPMLLEKPMATTVLDAESIHQHATVANALVWIGLEYRYMPPIARLVNEVQAGTIGTVRMVAIREHRYPFLDKVDNWNRFNRFTGGTLIEKCCHFFDLMAHIVQSMPRQVMASGGQDINHLDEKYEGETPDILDNALVIVDYENGARASLDLCMFGEGSVNEEEVAVTGDLGKLEAFLPSGIFRSGTRAAGRKGVVEEVITDARIAHTGFHHGSSYIEHLGFREAVKASAPVAVTTLDGLLSVAVGAAAQESISTGGTVLISKFLDCSAL